MKELPKRINKEIWLKPNYLILRFMRSKKAYKIKQNQPIILTIKETKIESKKNNEIQIHLRFKGRDEWFKDIEDIDLDIFIPISEWNKLNKLGN